MALTCLKMMVDVLFSTARLVCEVMRPCRLPIRLDTASEIIILLSATVYHVAECIFKYEDIGYF